MTDRTQNFSVTLCSDGSEPEDVQEAIAPIDQIRSDKPWRHPTQLELRKWLRKNGNFRCQLNLHSRNPVGEEAITFRLTYERFIHAEFMTHRVSRNASSARAIPYKKMKSWIEADPALPLHYGANQPGMQSGGMIEDVNGAESTLLEFLGISFQYCDKLFLDYDLHKEIVNRYDEVFAWINVVATFSRPAFMNMLSLRLTPYAHPNFQRLAKYMAIEYRKSTPQQLQAGEWHLPFVDDLIPKYREALHCNEVVQPISDNSPVLPELIAWSVARSAWTSYLTVNDKVATLSDAQRRHDDCVKLKHATPLEHQKRARDDHGRNGGTTPGFDEYRHMIEGESSDTFDFSILDGLYAEHDYVLPGESVMPTQFAILAEQEAKNFARKQAGYDL